MWTTERELTDKAHQVLQLPDGAPDKGRSIEMGEAEGLRQNGPEGSGPWTACEHERGVSGDGVSVQKTRAALARPLQSPADFARSVARGERKGHSLIGEFAVHRERARQSGRNRAVCQRSCRLDEHKCSAAGSRLADRRAAESRPRTEKCAQMPAEVALLEPECLCRAAGGRLEGRREKRSGAGAAGLCGQTRGALGALRTRCHCEGCSSARFKYFLRLLFLSTLFSRAFPFPFPFPFFLSHFSTHCFHSIFSCWAAQFSEFEIYTQISFFLNEQIFS